MERAPECDCFIEKRVKCFENTFFVFRFRRLVRRSPRRSVLGAGANAPLEEPDCTDTADSILPEDVGIVLIESVAIWNFRRAYLARKPSEILTSRSARKKCQASLCHTIAQFQSSAGKLSAFGIGAFALRHCPGEVPTISRKPRLNAG